VGDLLHHLSRAGLPIEEGIGGTGMNAGPAGLADLVVPGELPGKGLAEGYGPHRADGGAPAAVDAAVQIYERFALHLQAAVIRQMAILHFYAGLGADGSTQPAMNAIITDGGLLNSNAEVRLVHLRLARRPQIQCSGGADPGAHGT